MDSEEFNAILQKLGWSQADLAERLSAAARREVSARTVNRWAQGRAQIHPGLAAYLRLALRVQEVQVKL